MNDLVFIGDVHLERIDSDLESFLSLLDHLAGTAATVVLAGDLFNLWIGRRELEQPHHAAVLEGFVRLRSRGVVLRYLEGNRDYRIEKAYGGTHVDDAPAHGLVEAIGGRNVFAIHGDLANLHDRSYRNWRRFSRSLPVWVLFNALPRRMRLRLADRMENRLRSSNLEYKSSFPEEEVREYAAGFFRQGHDTVVLGHFHVEQDLEARPPSPAGRILVLPEWKESRRHLRISTDGAIRFEDWEG